MIRILLASALFGLFLGGCGGADPEPVTDTSFQFPPAPDAPAAEAPLAPSLRADLEDAVDGLTAGELDPATVERISAGDDPRAAWLVSDLLRFVADPGASAELAAAFEGLTGVDASADPTFALSPWQSITNHLIAWDLPAPPDYRELKGRLFTSVEPGWTPFFDDPDAAIDYRLLSWGGVLIDDRPLDDPDPCPDGCIPALDDPELTDAAGGSWYPDDRLVFGVEVGGEAVAFPQNIMQVHEMVNITIDDRRLGIPYCTLCGSAQAYFTDRDTVDGEPLVLRTSGLLSRSNKFMYELQTSSAFDTFTGEALSGPLHDRGVELPQTTVVTGTWKEWRKAHPETKIVAEDGGIGRSYPLDPLAGRDDGGPIFPIGDADPRLPVQESVVGVIAADGKPVAFGADAARNALEGGGVVEAGGVALELDGGGLRAVASGGAELPTHEAFWFAWSQFHPNTVLWEPPG